MDIDKLFSSDNNDFLTGFEGLIGETAQNQEQQSKPAFGFDSLVPNEPIQQSNEQVVQPQVQQPTVAQSSGQAPDAFIHRPNPTYFDKYVVVGRIVEGRTTKKYELENGEVIEAGKLHTILKDGYLRTKKVDGNYDKIWIQNYPKGSNSWTTHANAIKITNVDANGNVIKESFASSTLQAHAKESSGIVLVEKNTTMNTYTDSTGKVYSEQQIKDIIKTKDILYEASGKQYHASYKKNEDRVVTGGIKISHTKEKNENIISQVVDNIAQSAPVQNAQTQGNAFTVVEFLNRELEENDTKVVHDANDTKVVHDANDLFDFDDDSTLQNLTANSTYINPESTSTQANTQATPVVTVEGGDVTSKTGQQIVDAILAGRDKVKFNVRESSGFELNKVDSNDKTGAGANAATLMMLGYLINDAINLGQ